MHEKNESMKDPALEFLPCLDSDGKNYAKDKRQKHRYADFFGGDPYPVTLDVVEKRDDTERQVQFLEEILREYLPLYRQAQILDAGCGYGRHAVRLWEKGYHVTAADVLYANCEYVRNRNREMKILHTDLAELDREASYDFIYSMYTSIGYEEEKDRKVLARLAEQLHPNGVLCMDIENQKRKHKQVEMVFEKLNPGTGVGVKLYLHGRYYYMVLSHKKRRFKIHTLSYRVYSAEELLEMLSPYGMRCIRKYGDYDRSEFSEHAKRCLMIFRKAQS